MSPQNLLFILSDEHNPRVLGCAGHSEVQTPNLDLLARAGTRYTNAVCASPICVPARASLATGRQVFENGSWDNVAAYDGVMPSWHHVLRQQGHRVVSIGKLHYRGHPGDDYGFSQSILPMHIHEGRGEVKMLLRDPPVRLSDGSQMLRGAKAGLSDYNQYDLDITQAAIEWLLHEGTRDTDRPWVLFVSLVAPHFPLTVPEEFFAMYEDRDLTMPKDYVFGLNEHAHPFVRQYGAQCGYNQHFKSQVDVRRALAGYYGLISFLDHNVGRLLRALQDCGLAQTTRIIYSSDHGDNAGARGLWGKSTMYKESVGIPLIAAGEGIPSGGIVESPVSHIDLYPTILQAVGCLGELSTASERATSILGDLPSDRRVFSEYHTVGSTSGIFMLQDASTKYVHYCDLPPELYDLRTDPEELINLAPSMPHLVAEWEAMLQEICDPNAIDAKAKARQAQLVELFGGREAISAGKGIGGFSPTPKQSSAQV